MFCVHGRHWHALQLLFLLATVEPETLPQQLLRQVDEATTMTWRQVTATRVMLSSSCRTGGWV